jgi:hypothetical protein
MGLSVQLTNLPEDLTGFLGLQSDAARFKRQDTLRPWFETAKHIDDSLICGHLDKSLNAFLPKMDLIINTEFLNPVPNTLMLIP